MNHWLGEGRAASAVLLDLVAQARALFVRSVGELGSGVPLTMAGRSGIVELARGADVLIHEGQYTPEELPRFRGWGHSSWAQAVEVAERAKVKQLVITHHDPDHNDAFLRDIERQCRERFPDTVLAREKMDITF